MILQPTTQRLRLRLFHARTEFETEQFAGEIERVINSPLDSRGRNYFTDAQLREINEDARSRQIDDMISLQSWTLDVASKSPSRSVSSSQVLRKSVGQRVDRHLP